MERDRRRAARDAEAGSGVIAGISSVAGYRGLAGSEAYGATKAAQINLLESLRVHVSRRGLRVVTVCPGFVRTDLTAGNDFPMPFMIEPSEAATAICNGLSANAPRSSSRCRWPC